MMGYVLGSHVKSQLQAMHHSLFAALLVLLTASATVVEVDA